MGSPRMEGLDDVARVTRSVCESLIEDEALEVSLVPESGMLMAEIVFPLPKAGSNEGATPRIRETERVTALVRFLEEKIVHESVVCLMEKGSDDRSTFHGEQRLNKYFTGMYARPRICCTAGRAPRRRRRRARSRRQSTWCAACGTARSTRTWS